MTPDAPERITGESLEWERLTTLLRARLRTEYGLRAAEALVPLPDGTAIRRSLERIGEMMALEAEYGAPDFAGVRVIDELLERAEKAGILSGEELGRVLATQRAALALARKLRLPEDAPLLRRLAAKLDPLPAWCEALSHALTPDGELSEAAFPHLGELRQEIAHRRERIHRILEGLLHSRALEPMLQEKIYSVRGSRYVLPLKADFKGQMKGIVHDVSASGATLFVEPEPVVDETNGLILEERRYANEVEAILRRLSAMVSEVAPVLCGNLTWIGRVDLLHAQASLSADYGGTLPEVGEHERIELRGVAHPLMMLEGAEVVRNDLVLGGEARCLVVSGANTGGKTVLLKAVGLSLLLTAHGMPVPALAGSRVDRFAYVGADIGDQQNLSHSLSTFSAQIETLARMLERAGPASVILIDEILTGTEPQQGAALAGAVLDELVRRGALCLITTHYAELKSFAGTRPGFANASVSFDPERLRPTYRLRVGLPGASYAFSIARRHGLAEALVGDARGRLEAGALAPDALLDQLHREEVAHQERESALHRRETELEQAREALARREETLADREREQRRREKGRIGAELQAARRRIAAVIRELQGIKTLPEAGRMRERLATVESEVREALAEPPPVKPAPLDWEFMHPGDPVYLVTLRRTAAFQELLDKGRIARLRVGGLVFEVPVDELATAPPQPSPRKPHPAETRAMDGNGYTALQEGLPGAGCEGTPPGPVVLPGEENTLDLRGLRLVEALERTEQFFDLCVVKHVSPVLLIHGHGTGKLKAGIREKLVDNPYVAAFRAGEGREGGDGVTVVALKL